MWIADEDLRLKIYDLRIRTDEKIDINNWKKFSCSPAQKNTQSVFFCAGGETWSGINFCSDKNFSRPDLACFVGCDPRNMAPVFKSPARLKQFSRSPAQFKK
jgi:hypothetical protein